MLHYLEGDIFESDCTIIIHQANCKKRMGKGIAETIAKRYPEVEQKDNEFPYEGKERLGKYSFAYSKKEKRYIFNLYGQVYPGKPKYEKQEDRYRAFYEGMMRIMQYVHALEKKIQEKNIPFTIKIGVPDHIASGYAGGSWEMIKKILEMVSDKSKRDIYVYKLN